MRDPAQDGNLQTVVVPGVLDILQILIRKPQQDELACHLVCSDSHVPLT
jgi:hypothetical protein